MAEFTHLHVHTQYSLLDGAIRVKDLYPKINELGMDTVAVTDHGNMFGAIDLYNEAKTSGTKLIFGCETYVAATDRLDKTNRRNFHSYLNSMGYLEGFYYNPRIDKQLLRDHSEGLIGMSACLGGEVAQTLEKQGIAAAEEVAKEYASMFAPGDFFLELMPTATPEQQTLNDELRKMGPRLGIPLVATNDCHYVSQDDAAAHNVLMAIQTGAKMSDDKRLKHNVDSYYLKSPAEMNKHFMDIPEALENTVNIAKRCNVKLKLGNSFLPNYKVPPGDTVDTYITKLVDKGLERRFGEFAKRGIKFDPDQYRERCRVELAVITKMEFSGYFLIVWDFINWAKEHDIPVGPGRGSGAGSAVAWALRITDIDPLEFKLLFERFLNPERVSMPDFDVDFCMNRRDEVIKYVQGKYGKNQVGQIATFHQLKARGVIRDIARVMEIPFSEADKLAKLVPEAVQGKTLSVKESIEIEPELKKLYNESPMHRELLDIASRLEGLNRHAGMHAAGIVIAEQPIWEYVPCFRGQNDEIITQFAMKEVEKAGLVKFDFLGLKTLTVIQTAVRLINEQRRAKGNNEELDISLLEKNDADVFKLITKGDTTGVFQLESSGFREILKKLRPDCLEDIVAAVALYRPGPLEGGMVDDFIERKHGRKAVEYMHPDLEIVLADTYGVIVYQEQVMQIAQVLAGYSLGKADLLRRAMGKKNKEVMDAEKAGFVSGATGRGVDSKIAEAVFDLMAFFAGYGFNRSHSAAYGWVTYQTAFLKAHYPHEFMAGLMSCDADNVDNIVKFMSEARSMGLIVERPDVNESATDFTVVTRADGQKVIRFGMGAVKGVGSSAVDAILEARKSGEPFVSIYDLCQRVDTQKCNRRVLEALIKSGGFDSLATAGGYHRAQLLATLETALERGASEQRDRRSGQTSLFGLIEAPKTTPGQAKQGETYPDIEQWSAKEQLAFEKESLGFYITGHPLDRYRSDLARYANATTLGVTSGQFPSYVDQPRRYGNKDSENAPKGPGEVSIGGVVSQYREMMTKKGDKMARFILEDAEGSLEVVVFPKTFEKVRHALVSDEPILVSGKIKNEGTAEESAWKMLLDNAQALSELRQAKTTRVDIHLNADQITPEQLKSLRGILENSKGNCHAVVRLRVPGRSETVIPLGGDYQVEASEDLLARLERLFGDRVATLG